MAPKKKKTQADRHKPSFMVRIPWRLRAPLEAVAEANAADVSEIVRRAVLDLLKSEGKWPPPPNGSPS